MATVRAFQIAGIQLWFWSDDHDPPHFHAKRRDEWEVKVRFLYDPSEMIVEIGSNKKLPRKVMKELTSLAEQYRVELLDQWEEIRKSK